MDKTPNCNLYGYILCDVRQRKEDKEEEVFINIEKELNCLTEV